jgi:hypothetical protein
MRHAALFPLADVPAYMSRLAPRMVTDRLMASVINSPTMRQSGKEELPALGEGPEAANGSVGFVEALRGVLGRRGHGYFTVNWLKACCRRSDTQVPLDEHGGNIKQPRRVAMMRKPRPDLLGSGTTQAKP